MPSSAALAGATHIVVPGLIALAMTVWPLALAGAATGLVVRHRDPFGPFVELLTNLLGVLVGMLPDPRAAFATLGVICHRVVLRAMRRRIASRAPILRAPLASVLHEQPAMTTPLDREERDRQLAGSPSLDELRSLAEGCRACALWRRATQTVFGDGPDAATLLIVGEQPGNSEDLEGAPFVGPAGQLLDRALVEAGIDREAVYVTNVVKHFKWRRAPSGKRRIHQKPDRGEVEACRPWLEAEVARIRPRLVVCLGATAAQALLGRSFRVTKEHGKVLPSDLGPVVATIHPSAVLRAPDDSRETAYRGMVDDLRAAAAHLA
jgi:uracil-DNA glycosylase family protein